MRRQLREGDEELLSAKKLRIVKCSCELVMDFAGANQGFTRVGVRFEVSGSILNTSVNLNSKSILEMNLRTLNDAE
jgi:hypothetical protein